MILIELAKDRTKVGRLTLLSADGATLLGPLAALGKADDAAAKAHGNPSCDPLHSFGDTPLGNYECHVQPPQTPVHSFGPNKTISLRAVSGDALTAAKNGRSGLLIHGGDPGPHDSLRPTHGCVRLFNEDMKTLTAAMARDSSVGLNCTIKLNQTQAGVYHMAESLLLSSNLDALTEDLYPNVEAPSFAKSLAANAGPQSPVIQARFTIDTDLKGAKSPLTSEIITAFFNSQPASHAGLIDIAAPVIAASHKYGIDATYILAHAIWETGWGTSTICRLKNNLFGYTAYDHDPVESATAFASRAECIDYVMNLVNQNYLSSGGKYFVVKACVGNKSYGMNVHYASDPSWGAGIASVGRQLENFAARS